MDTVENRNEIYEELKQLLETLSDFEDMVHDTIMNIKPLMYDKEDYFPVQVGISTYKDELESMIESVQDQSNRFNELTI